MLPLDRLIVIAGPSCCGKSTFIWRLRHGELPHIEGALGIEDIDQWVYKDTFYMKAGALQEIKRSPARNIFLHWTMPRPSLKLVVRKLLTLFAHDKNRERLELLRSTNHLTILAIYTSQPSLIKRVHARRIRVCELRRLGKIGGFAYWKQMRYTQRLEKFYSNPSNILSLYQRWFLLCRTLRINAIHLVESEREPSLVPIEEWPEITRLWGVRDDTPILTGMGK